MEKQRKLKVVILSTLIVGILTLTIAFSAISRTLKIDGIGKMDTASWDVHFENLSDASITRDAIEVSKPNISLDKGTVENINVKLTKPKDEIKYVVDIVNKGTIDAEVNIMTISDLTEEEKKLIDFGVYYLNGTKINKYDLLEPGDIKSIAIKIRCKDDITEFDLPSEPLEVKLSCQIEYVQSGAEMVITPNGDLENTTSYLAMNQSSNSNFFNGNLSRNKIESITFLSTLKVPTDARTTAWDASLNKDGSVVAWYTDLDNNGLYEVNIGGNGGVTAPEDSAYLFSNFTKLKELNFNGNFDTSMVMYMSSMFYYCSSLVSLNLSNFDTSNVISMGQMFYGCSHLINLDLNSFSTSNVTNMSHMFRYCSSLVSMNLNSFDTSRVTDMSEMFNSCRSLKILDLDSFNTSNVVNMTGMFSMCESLTSLDLSNFNTANVEHMSYMFSLCSIIKNLDLSSFDTSNVTNMGYMFDRCSLLTKLDLTNFDTLNVTIMHGMFKDCISLTILFLSNFNFDKVTSYSNMFSNANISIEVIVTNETQELWLNEKFHNITVKNINKTAFNLDSLLNKSYFFVYP